MSLTTTTSSPLTMFARSQTPIEISSSPQCSQKGTGRGNVALYKTSQTTRDSFSTSFVSAKQILGTRSSAENVPLGSPSPPKFKPPPSGSPTKLRRPAPCSPAMDTHKKQGSKPVAEWDAVPVPDGTVVRILPSDVRKKKKTDNIGPLQLEKATARKKEWTPTKPTLTLIDENVSGFGTSLAKKFGHSYAGIEKAANTEDGALTKRRKIDLTSLRHEVAIPKLKPLKTTKPRSKSPAKKGLTITGLATSHYLGEDKKEEPTIMTQWMASTQARTDGAADAKYLEVKVKRTTSSKAKKPKTRLRSPETALKTLDSQEVVFATLSQCARDESPTLIRDTAEAMKQSIHDLTSSPVRTQQTAIYSIESTTPQKVGTARFRSRKGLWTAADRDENDALLHMEDPFDTPAKRNAFAGEDALFEHKAAIPNVDGPTNSLGLLAALDQQDGTILTEDTTTIDIDDVTPPPIAVKTAAPAQIRPYSTWSRSPSSKRTKETEEKSNIEHESQSLSKLSASPAKKKLPAKPNYASWTDEHLKAKTKECGFKRLRARKSMIDKLDESWAEDNGVDPARVKAATKAASQTTKVLQGGDILGSVHALAARPAPKIKKSRVKKSKDGIDKTKPEKHRATAKEEAENMVLDQIVDVGDIDTSNAFDRLAQMNDIADDALETLEPSTAPVKGTGVKAKIKKKQRPLTHLPTIPPKPTQNSSPAFASPRRRRHTSPAANISISSSQNGEVPLKSLIRKAIEQPPADDTTRNHQANPTWYEKIIMYDPIVLEDLTAWLNTEGFNAIGEDSEIDIAEVKDWCHENGVCCLWRGGWRETKRWPR